MEESVDSLSSEGSANYIACGFEFHLWYQIPLKRKTPRKEIFSERSIVDPKMLLDRYRDSYLSMLNNSDTRLGFSRIAFNSIKQLCNPPTCFALETTPNPSHPISNWRTLCNPHVMAATTRFWFCHVSISSSFTSESYRLSTFQVAL